MLLVGHRDERARFYKIRFPGILKYILFFCKPAHWRTEAKRCMDASGKARERLWRMSGSYDRQGAAPDCRNAGNGRGESGTRTDGTGGMEYGN